MMLRNLALAATLVAASGDCPGGSLSACIALCPSTSDVVYQACVDTCLTRCAQPTPSPAPTPGPAPTPAPAPQPATCQVLPGKNNKGRNLEQALGVSDAAGCCDACLANSDCIGYTWAGAYGECWLKDLVDEPVDDGASTSGTVNRGPPAPTPPTPPPSGPPRLGKGWNLGNTLDAQDNWPPQPREEWIFESLREKGFDWVRIPVQWGCRADSSGNIDGAFMSQVEETVGWAKKHGLVALINTHHEDWFDDGGDLNRLVNIWRQIARRFQNYADNELVFEVFNEPNHMSLDTLNQMNEAVLPVIRETNPTRLVFLGGLKQMGRWWINANPDAMRIPADEHLGLTVHSYDPWSFAGDHPSTQSFSDADAADAENQQAQLATWAQARGIKQVILNEFGVTVDQPNKGDRMKYYRANSQACANHGQGYAIWDDNGWWRVLDRGSRSWDEDVLSNLVAPFQEVSMV